MFDDIHFFIYDLTSVPVTTGSFSSDERAVNGSEILSPEVNSLDLAAFVKSRQMFVHISAKLYMFLHPPVFSAVENHLLYLKSFTLFYCDKNYYTKCLTRNFDNYLIMFTYDGKGVLEYEGHNYTLTKGTGIFIDTRKPHTYYTAGDTWVHSVFYFDGDSAQSYCRAFSSLPRPVFHQETVGNYHSNMEKILRAYQNTPLLRDNLIDGYIHDILSTLLADTTAHASLSDAAPSIFQYLITYMNHNYQLDLSLDYLAGFAGLNKYYLSRKFHELYGFSPIDYIINLRIQQAQQLLEISDLKIKEIAHSVGIHDMNNFTSLFRKKTGMSPKQYRNKLKIMDL